MRCDEPLVQEDPYHPSLTFNVSVLNDSFIPQNIKTSYTDDYSREDFYLLYHITDWVDLGLFGLCNDVHSCLEIFYSKVLACIDQAIPKKRFREIPKTFFSLDLVRKIKRKNRLHRQVKKGKASLSTITAEFEVLYKSGI